MLKRWIAILLCLTFTGCAGTTELPPEAVPAAVQPPQVAETLVFLVDSGLGDVYLRGAQNFADQIEQITGGALVVDVRTSAQADQEFTAGKAQLLFLDGVPEAPDSSLMNLLAVSFLYADPTVFSMLCNAPRLLELLGKDLRAWRGMTPLGAYYRPGMQLLSTWQTTDLAAFANATLALDPASGSAENFRRLGAGIIEEPDRDERAALLISGEVQGVEMGLEELAAISWTGTDFYLTLSYHTLRPVWLVAQADFYDSLEPWEQAAITEAAAQLHGDIDHLYLQQEAAHVQKLQEQGLLVSADFANVRGEVFVTARDEAQEPTESERYLQSFLSLFNYDSFH